ncbi:MAG: radical SAM protein [Nanoarchaeota archaeon]
MPNFISKINNRPYLLKVGKRCNNNCDFCDYLSVKNDYEKTFNDICKELRDIKKKGASKIYLPCNAEIRKDFVQIIDFASNLNLEIHLISNGRFFYYQVNTIRLNKFKNLFIELLYLHHPQIYEKITKTENTHNQLIRAKHNLKNHFDKDRFTEINLAKEFMFLLLDTYYPSPYQFKTNYERIEKNGVVFKKPFSMVLELTLRCNKSCHICYQAKFRSSIDSKKELTLKHIKRIIDDIKPLSITLGGGEPFLRKDLMLILRYLESKKINYTILTNGSLISANRIKALSKMNYLRGIVVSIVPEKKKSNKFQEYLKKMHKLILSLNSANIHASISSVLTIDNLNTVKQILDLCKATGTKTFNLILNQEYCNTELRSTKAILSRQLDCRPDLFIKNGKLTKSDYLKLKKDINSLQSKAKKLNINFCTQPLSLNKMQDIYSPDNIGCITLLSPIIRVDPYGNVIFCRVIRENFGNLLNRSYKDIWLSDKFNRFRSRIARQLLPICKRCSQIFEFT